MEGRFQLCKASKASLSRDRHGLVAVGDKLFAVGGSSAIGSERSIEMFDGEKWQEVNISAHLFVRQLKA